MPAAYEQLLQQLCDETQPVPRFRLSELSDLDRAQLERLQAVWEAIATPKRRTLIEELGELADLHIELTFERVYRLALQDPDAQVRRTAIQNLWECQDPTLVPPLVEALGSDPEPGVRAAAAAALGRFVFLGEVEELGRDPLHGIEEALLTASEEDEVQEVRQCSLESLGFSSRDEVPSLIERAYGSGEESLVRSALLAMGRSANDRWRPQVLAQLHSPAPELRIEAARAAGELELMEAVPDLIDLLEDVHRDVRHAAIWSLGQLGGSQAAEALMALLEHMDDEEESDVLEDALEHLAFVDGTHAFLPAEFDEPEEPST
jgi:HEAT repeat protein